MMQSLHKYFVEEMIYSSENVFVENALWVISITNCQRESGEFCKLHSIILQQRKTVILHRVL